MSERSVLVVASVLVGAADGVTTISPDGDTQTELGGRAVHALARDRGDWWALADHTAVLRRSADGDWQEVAAAAGERLTSICPTGGGAFIGTADGTLLRFGDGQLVPVDGFDAVDGRDEWHAVGSSKPYVRSLSVSADGRAVLANVHVGGIPRSGNGGASWKPTIDVEADVHQVLAHPTDPKLVVAAAAVGFAESRDAGVTWDVVTEGLHASYCRAVAFLADTVLVSASDGPSTERGAVYRRSLDGGAFTRCDDGVPEWLPSNVDSGCIDANREVAAFADSENVYRSDDAGATWHRIAPSPAGVRAVGVA